jgi:hypothetical protein
MPLIAIIHLPDHTAVGGITEDIAALPDNIPGAMLVAVHEFPNRAELRQGCLGCGKGKMVGWGRHRKGYMVCGTCGGRNPKVRRWFTGALFDWFGANLLGDNAPALFRTPDGYGPPQ